MLYKPLDDIALKISNKYVMNHDLVKSKFDPSTNPEIINLHRYVPLITEFQKQMLRTQAGSQKNPPH